MGETQTTQFNLVSCSPSFSRTFRGLNLSPSCGDQNVNLARFLRCPRTIQSPVKEVWLSTHHMWSRVCLASFLAFGWVLLSVTPMRAVASFSRQTGLACSACHTTIPELTPLGRLFKLNGYTMTGIPVITSKSGPTKAGLNLNSWLPIAAFIQFSNTVTQRPQPGSQNGSFEFPQAASLFLAGAMASHAGGFVQVTYSGQSDHFSWDNTDVRYANRTKLAGKELIYGVTFNNNPTVEDLWNDTPAWGFPWVSSDSAPSPLASPVIAGPLAQDVAGLGAYAMFNQHLYLDVTGYRSEHLGGPEPITGMNFGINIRGVAPYWRLAWQQSRGNNYLEVGTYGIHVSSTPGAVIGSDKDEFTDVAADLQFERVFPKAGNDLLTIHSTYIHESSSLLATFLAGGAAFPHHDLNTFRADGIWHFGNKYAASFGPFVTTGTADPVLYAEAPVSGSSTGGPGSRGYIANFTYWPVQNIELGLQYTGYTRFNGASVNYDGARRNASDNNSIYMLVWFIF